MARQTRVSKLLRSSALWFSALVVIGAITANAATLDGAKSAGQIGEGTDGYLHLVDKNAPGDVKALVKEVNSKRKAKYQDIAKSRGASVESVASLAGAKLVKRTPAGQYAMDSSGKMRKK